MCADAASDVSGLSPSSRGGVSLAVHVSGELCVLWSLGVLNELRSHYGNTLGYHWCGVMCVGPRTLRVMQCVRDFTDQNRVRVYISSHPCYLPGFGYYMWVPDLGLAFRARPV